MSTAAENKYTGLSFQLRDKVEELTIVRAKLSREKGEGERLETALSSLHATLKSETAAYDALSNDLQVNSDLCSRAEEERDILRLRIQEELYTQEALNKQVLELEQSLRDQHQEVVDLEASHQLAAAAQADLQRQLELLRSQLVTVEAMYQQANHNTVRVTVERDELASLEVLRSTPSRSFVTPTTPGKQTDSLPSPSKPPGGFLSRVGNIARRANKDAGSSYGHRATTGPTPSSPAYRSTHGPGLSAGKHLPPQPSRSNPYAPTTTNECYWDNTSFWLVSSDPQQPDDNFVSALLIGTDVNGVLVAMSFDHEAQPGETEWNLAPVSQLIQEQTAYNCELRLVTLEHACALDPDSDQGFMEEYASGLEQMMSSISTVDWRQECLDAGVVDDTYEASPADAARSLELQHGQQYQVLDLQNSAHPGTIHFLSEQAVVLQLHSAWPTGEPLLLLVAPTQVLDLVDTRTKPPRGTPSRRQSPAQNPTHHPLLGSPQVGANISRRNSSFTNGPQQPPSLLTGRPKTVFPLSPEAQMIKVNKWVAKAKVLGYLPTPTTTNEQFRNDLSTRSLMQSLRHFVVTQVKETGQLEEPAIAAGLFSLFQNNSQAVRMTSRLFNTNERNEAEGYANATDPSNHLSWIDQVFTALTDVDYATFGRSLKLADFHLDKDWMLGEAKHHVHGWIGMVRDDNPGRTWREAELVLKGLLTACTFTSILTPMVMPRAKLIYEQNQTRPSRYWEQIEDLFVNHLEGANSIFDKWTAYKAHPDAYSDAYAAEFRLLTQPHGRVQLAPVPYVAKINGRSAGRINVITPRSGRVQTVYSTQEVADQFALVPCPHHIKKIMDSPGNTASLAEVTDAMHECRACINLENVHLRCTVHPGGLEELCKRRGTKEPERQQMWNDHKAQVDQAMRRLLGSEGRLNYIGEISEGTLQYEYQGVQYYVQSPVDDGPCF